MQSRQHSPAATNSGPPASSATKQNAEFADRKLICCDCHAAFIWTVGEQRTYLQRGWEHQPKRCLNCRAHKRKILAGEK